MTVSVQPMGPAELSRLRPLDDAGLGALRTDRGNLPLDRLAVDAKITGLVSRTVVRAEFVNVHDTALEATYVFPLPDRAAVTGMTMTADNRTVEAELQERGAAREAYDRAVEAGRRASIAEEERPDVFTMRVGNIVAGERVTIELRLVGPLPYEDGAATFRFPLVVAPRYVPGTPQPGTPVGSGWVRDTDAVPDASRISPPILLPGFANPLRLSIDVEIDPAGLSLGEIRSSLHTVTTAGGHVSIGAGERADRDFVLRLPYAAAAEAALAVPDGDSDDDDREQGTFQLTVLPPDGPEPSRRKDVVLLLDRSGSMGGWKMVAARRAAARVVDTLTTGDRFAVFTFDHQVERPDGLDAGLVEATDRNRFRAVEHLARVDARGGTELLAPLDQGLKLLTSTDRDKARDRVLVLVTDGQVGNEDQILADITPLIGSTRLHTVGIDRAVNAGFLGRLAALGAGRCELVESEDRLDEAMEHIHRRIGAPAVTGLTVQGDGIELLPDTQTPARPASLYPGVPLVVTGRYAGAAAGTIAISGRTRDDREFAATVPVQRREEPAVTAAWARARLRDLEDRYVAGETGLEAAIVALSLRFGVLCRFTAFVAVDSRVVNEDGETRRVIQPVELPSGWDTPGGQVFLASAPMRPMAAPMAGAAPMAAADSGTPRARTRVTRGSSRMPTSFAAVPASAVMGKAVAPGNTPLSIADARRLAAVEAGRLRDAADRPAYERRDVLDDLASRLRVLLDGLTGDEYAPLRDLLPRLTANTGVDGRWADAVRTLTDFARPETAERKPFWKR